MHWDRTPFLEIIMLRNISGFIEDLLCDAAILTSHHDLWSASQGHNVHMFESRLQNFHTIIYMSIFISINEG